MELLYRADAIDANVVTQGSSCCGVDVRGDLAQMLCLSLAVQASGPVCWRRHRQASGKSYNSFCDIALNSWSVSGNTQVPCAPSFVAKGGLW